MKEDQVFRPQRTMMVTGCDASLPYGVVDKELKKYFSAYGSFVYGDVTASGAIITLADVYVGGQEGVEKALERSGHSVGGLNFVVTRVVPLPKKTIRTGYIHPHNFTLFTKEQIENPNLYCAYDENQEEKSETTEGNQKKKKKKKKKKKSRTREGNQKKKSETRDGNQKMKGVVISF